MREFEQMELEFFCHPNQSDEYFKVWLARRQAFYRDLGINQERLRFREHAKTELAHYSKNCTDVEYEFPFGWKELEGIAHRADFDLSNHGRISGKDLSVFDDVTNTKFVPHVVECSVGVDRLFFTILFDAYCEEEIAGEKRVVLKLHHKLAPVKAAVLPLVKKLEEPALKLFKNLKSCGIVCDYDDSGSIGKRYRRQDEIGTPFCITIDYQTLEDAQVTIRFRDDLTQIRVGIDTIVDFLQTRLSL
jgi:glycyl-tRNA synthetase